MSKPIHVQIIKEARALVGDEKTWCRSEMARGRSTFALRSRLVPSLAPRPIESRKKLHQRLRLSPQISKASNAPMIPSTVSSRFSTLR
jgi:hypothetical protein